MKHSKLVGWGLIVTVGLAILGGFGAIQATETFEMLLGIALIVFCVWGGVILIKNSPK